MSKLLQIRPEAPTDFLAIAEVIRLSFDQTDGSEVDLVVDWRLSSDYIPELSLVALLEDKIIGYAMFHFVTLEGELSRRVVDLGPVGVLPEFQRQGVGSALIRRGLASCVDRDEPLVMCLGHESYYPRFGFLPSRIYGILPSWDAMLVYPIQKDLERFMGLNYPQE